MACTISLTGRTIGCRDQLGGLKNVWFSADGFTDGDFPVPTAGAIADSTVAMVFNNVQLVRNLSSFTQTVTSSTENGTTFVSQEVTMVCRNTEAADVARFSEYAKGFQSIIVQDLNDNYFIMGRENGCTISGGTYESGTAIGDASGFTLTFMAEELTPAPFGPAASGTLLVYTPV
tara:strand:+ start:1402 stop:1926 length:525 start_codon:yes stop_codon:yes gene_type:complete